MTDSDTRAARPHARAAVSAGATDWARLDPHVRPDLSRSALVTIDVQADFLDGGGSPLPGTAEVIPAIARLVGAYRAAGRPVVHVVRLYDGTDVDLVRRTAIASGAPIVRPGSRGSQLAGSLRTAGSPDLDAPHLLAGGVQRLGTGEVAIWKPRWSAFHRTPLDEHLTSSGVNTLVIAGFNFPNCPRATISDASARDYRIVAARDALSGLVDLHLDEAAAIGAVPATTATITALLATST